MYLWILITGNRTSWSNDVCVLILEQELPLNNETISVIPIERNESLPMLGTSCQLTGIGSTKALTLTSATSTASERTLQYTNLNVIQETACSEAFPGYFVSDRKMMCANTTSSSGRSKTVITKKYVKLQFDSISDISG